MGKKRQFTNEQHFKDKYLLRSSSLLVNSFVHRKNCICIYLQLFLIISSIFLLFPLLPAAMTFSYLSHSTGERTALSGHSPRVCAHPVYSKAGRQQGSSFTSLEQANHLLDSWWPPLAGCPGTHTIYELGTPG